MTDISCLICLEKTEPISDKSDNYNCECKKVYLHDVCYNELLKTSNKCLICKNPTHKTDVSIEISSPYFYSYSLDTRILNPERNRYQNIFCWFANMFFVSLLIIGIYKSEIEKYDLFTRLTLVGITLSYSFVIDYYMFLIIISLSHSAMLWYHDFNQTWKCIILFGLYFIYFNLVHICSVIVFMNNDFYVLLNYCLAYVLIMYFIFMPMFIISYIVVWCRS